MSRREKSKTVMDQVPQSEANILSTLSAQAENNRLMLQTLISRAQSSHLPSLIQPHHSGIASLIPALQCIERGPTNFWDDVRQNQPSRGISFTNEQSVRNEIVFLTSSILSSSNPTPANGGGLTYGGSLSSLAVHGDDSSGSSPLIQFLKSQIGTSLAAHSNDSNSSYGSSPLIQFLKSQIGTSTVPDNSYSNVSSSNSTIAAGTGNFPSSYIADQLALRNQLWNTLVADVTKETLVGRR